MNTHPTHDKTPFIMPLTSGAATLMICEAEQMRMPMVDSIIAHKYSVHSLLNVMKTMGNMPTAFHIEAPRKHATRKRSPELSVLVSSMLFVSTRRRSGSITFDGPIATRAGREGEDWA